MAAAEQRNGLDERIARVEAGYTGVTRQLEEIVQTMRRDREDLMAEIRRQKTPLTAMAGWASIIVTLGIAGVSASFWVTTQQINGVQGMAHNNSDRLNLLRGDFTALQGRQMAGEATLREQLGEIETQFRSGGQIYNARDHQQDVLIDQLWRKQFNEPLREDTPWPVLGRER